MNGSSAVLISLELLDDPDAQQNLPARVAKYAGWVGPLFCLLVTLGLCGGIGFAVFSTTAKFQSIEPYTTSLERVKQDENAIRVLGAPIKRGIGIFGSVQLGKDSGYADITYTVRGSRRRGSVHVTASMEDGLWTTSRMEFERRGTVYDLLPPTELEVGAEAEFAPEAIDLP